MYPVAVLMLLRLAVSRRSPHPHAFCPLTLVDTNEMVAVDRTQYVYIAGSDHFSVYWRRVWSSEYERERASALNPAHV